MTGLRISVAMAVFNGERFLRAQLESIVAQSRHPDELVICDDLSSDDSGKIVHECSSHTTIPIRYVVNERNLGSTRNFEKTIGLCNGPIVALADQDDVWYPKKLDCIEKAMQKSPETVGVFSDADLIDEMSRPMEARLWRSMGFNSAEQSQFASGDGLGVLIKHPVVTGATLAFRRECFDRIAPLPADEIHDKWISFLLTAYGRLEAIHEPLMQYRQHGKQQIGPGPLNLRERMGIAKSRGSDFYRHEVKQFRQLFDRLERRREHFPHAERALRELERKIVHLEHRATLGRTRVSRIPYVLGEMLNGHYWRYSGGWKSVAKDLMMAR